MAILVACAAPTRSVDATSTLRASEASLRLSLRRRLEDFRGASDHRPDALANLDLGMRWTRFWRRPASTPVQHADILSLTNGSNDTRISAAVARHRGR